LNVFYFIQEYSEDSNEDPDVDVENQYYSSKALELENPKAALEQFQKVSILIFLYTNIM